LKSVYSYTYQLTRILCWPRVTAIDLVIMSWAALEAQYVRSPAPAVGTFAACKIVDYIVSRLRSGCRKLSQHKIRLSKCIERTYQWWNIDDNTRFPCINHLFRQKFAHAHNCFNISGFKISTCKNCHFNICTIVTVIFQWTYISKILREHFSKLSKSQLISRVSYLQMLLYSIS